ncbi:MAG: mechanosensitive ion channel [Saprospiraceae bacterium]
MWQKIWNTILGHLEQLGAVVPNLITAFAVLLVGFIIARILRKLISKVLAKTGIDKLAAQLNEVDMIANTRMEIKLSTMLASIVYYLIMFIFLMAAIEVLGMEAISNLMTDMINYLPKAIAAFFVFLLGIVLSDMVKKLVRTTCDSLGIASGKLLSNMVFYFLFLNVALVTMKQAELQTTFMENNISIILGGVILAFSIGYGLASRSLMSNMLSAYYNKDRFEVDDEITVGGQRGKVIAMDNTSLTLRTEEGEVVVPLSKLSTEQYTIHRKNRFVPIEGGQKGS